MASFPIETLQRIGAAYDEALAALQNSDLERIQTLMNEVDALAQSLPRGEHTPSDDAETSLLQAVQRNHKKLLTAITVDHSKTGESLKTAKKGRRALKSYGSRTDPTGTHLESIT